MDLDKILPEKGPPINEVSKYIQKYKNELSINGDLSYLNLDWKPVPIIPKFVDIVVNGIADRSYDIKVFSQDPYGVDKRTKYMESVLRDMNTKELNDFSQEQFGINLYENDPEKLMTQSVLTIIQNYSDNIYFINNFFF